jgi:integrase
MSRRRTITLKLTQRPDGMWCKKIDGRLRYFGPAHCPEAEARRELLEYLRVRETGAAAAVTPISVTVQDLSDQYGTACLARVEAGKLERRTYDLYADAIQDFGDVVGWTAQAGAVPADQFARVAEAWSGRLGVHRFNNYVQAVRTAYRWAVENRLLDKPPHFGGAFRKAPAAQGRLSAIQKREERGERRFKADELRKIIAAARGPLRVFVLLALNGGMYSADVSDLRWGDIRRDGRHWLIDTTRRKTGIPRRLVLWPEVVRELERRERGADDVLIFRTIHGNPWNQRNGTDSIGLLFRRLLDRLDLRREGVGFGSFRHTHVSAVGDHPDQAAARMVRGHLIEGIEQHYDFPDTRRLKSVTDLARARLLVRTGAGRVAGRGRGGGRSRGSRRRAAPSAPAGNAVGRTRARAAGTAGSPCPA